MTLYVYEYMRMPIALIRSETELYPLHLSIHRYVINVAI